MLNDEWKPISPPFIIHHLAFTISSRILASGGLLGKGRGSFSLVVAPLVDTPTEKPKITCHSSLPRGRMLMAGDFHWGPANPHPLSKMRTELVWDGKYDEYGRRREVDLAACALPM